MNNIFPIYKPQGPTSFALMAKIKKLTGEQKVGHAGTLDPLAEGILVVGLGREATKQLSQIVKKEKEYLADIKLGLTSSTDDGEGQKVKSLKVHKVHKVEVENVLKKFTGIIKQAPPAYSAIKVSGQRAYKLARAGQVIELKSRPVEIKNIKILKYQYPNLKIKVVTGPGVYIRSLAKDIGQDLGVGGYLTGLKRIRVGQFTAGDGVNLNDLAKRYLNQQIKILKNGGVGVMPTDTLYGLVGLAENKKTIERIYKIKKRKPDELSLIITDRERLWIEIDQTCRDKYQQLGARVRTLAIRSFIYILLTKMIFAIILEVPVSLYLYGEVNQNAIIINSIFPPILMIGILGFFKVPGEENTRKIYQRIIDIIDNDKSFETKVAFVPKKTTQKRPLLIFGFTVFYSLTFFITLSLIYEFLSNLGFNLVSQIIFVFFVSVVSFFSYRIRQVTKELRLEEKASILSPIGDFFFMPMLSLGKFFSSGIAKLNFFIFIFDFIIEAPFKLIFEVVEEWISFVRKRKEEII